MYCGHMEGRIAAAVLVVLVLDAVAIVALPTPPPPPSPASCFNASSSSRRDCGFADQPMACQKAGCCWEELWPNPKALPWCF